MWIRILIKYLDPYTDRTQMVAHGKLTSSRQINEVNSCVEVLGKTSHTIPPLSTHQLWVPGGTKIGKIVNGIHLKSTIMN